MSGYRAFVHENPESLKYIVSYYHYPQRWNDNVIPFDDPIRDVNKWSPEMKYTNAENNGISDEIKQLPNNHGGIYMFYIKGVNIPFVENYILYIGRCKSTDSQNIRKRAKEYFGDNREMIRNMFVNWKECLYYRYFKETNNDRIDRLEVKLIRAILPPFNESIPNNIEIQPTIPAFNN